jgi:hypothetical protein
VTAKQSGPRIIGHEVLRRVARWEVPGHPLDPRKERAVLGAREKTYLVPPGIDVFELGIISRSGPHELLPIDEGGKPHWDGVVHLLVTEARAEAQRGLLLRAYRALHAAIREGAELDADITAWSRRGATHPIFGILRLATVDVWAARRRPCAPLGEGELDTLHAEVARRVATRIHATPSTSEASRRRR